MNQKCFKLKYTSKSNTVNDMKLMIIAKIRVIHIFSPNIQRVLLSLSFGYKNLLLMGWRNILPKCTCFFARIISFMLFTMLLLHMDFILKSFLFTIHVDLHSLKND